MNYDKNSFLAGISVGRTLKGWAAGSDGFSGGSGGGNSIPILISAIAISANLQNTILLRDSTPIFISSCEEVSGNG